jgi:hypothetical protein
VPVLRQAVSAFRGTDVSTEEELRWLWLACRAADVGGAAGRRGWEGGGGLLGPDHYAKHTDTNRKARNHKRQLEALGYDVILTPREARLTRQTTP